MLVRQACHLCDDALAIVHEVADGRGVEVEVVDVDAAGNEELLDRYTDQVPVTMIDGAVHDFWRVDRDRLVAALGG